MPIGLLRKTETKGGVSQGKTLNSCLCVVQNFAVSVVARLVIALAVGLPATRWWCGFYGAGGGVAVRVM
jgi:hypothetical protein